jgi:hypothetical protein
MNLTIWFEVATAMLLLVAICRVGANAANGHSRG